MALEDDLDTLHACAPGEFLDRRKALAQALRKSGRRDDAAVVAAAVKPTPAAWAVNQLARRNPGEMAELMGAGERLRGLLRASFTGRADAGAMADAQAAQREIVARLARLAVGHLEGVGAPGSAAVLERVAATLTTISTTGAWGGSPPGRLTKELEAPGIEALAALVGDVASHVARPNTTVNDAAAASALRHGEDRIQRGNAAQKGKWKGEEEEARRRERARAEEEARRVERARQEEEARRAAAEACARIERAEAALRAASEIEERARAALESARSAAGVAASERERREVTAREARRLATEQEKAAEEARRKAEAAVLAARSAEEEAAGAARAEQAAKAELSAAERAVARAAAGCIEAEEALVRERRAGERPPG